MLTGIAECSVDTSALVRPNYGNPTQTALNATINVSTSDGLSDRAATPVSLKSTKAPVLINVANLETEMILTSLVDARLGRTAAQLLGRARGRLLIITAQLQSIKYWRIAGFFKSG